MRDLTLLEEFDILSELQFPDFIYSDDSTEEKYAFSAYLASLSGRRILLLHNELINMPFVLASLKENHIEIIIKEGGFNIKKILLSNLSSPEFLKQSSDFAAELDRREKTTENSTRLKNILQYLRDNKYII